MPTFAQLKAKVALKLQDPNNTAVSEASVGDAINDAVRFWRYQRFWFNEASATITIPQGTQNITSLLPNDFLYEFQENAFVIAYDSMFYNLAKVSPYDFDREQLTNGYGIPYIYTYRNQQYQIYFLPDQNYTANVYYLKDYAELVGASDTNDFTTYADELLVYEALSSLSGENRQDLQMSNTYAAMADREAKNLITKTFKQTNLGRLEVETII